MTQPRRSAWKEGLWALGLSTALGLTAEPTPYCGVGSGLTTLRPPGVEVGTGAVRTVGTNRLLYLRVRFVDDVADPATPEETAADLAEAGAILKRISHGAFHLESTASPVIPLGTSRQKYAGPSGFDQLLEDARAAGIAAGHDYREFDLDVVRHSGVPGFAGGNARLGARGAQVQIGGAQLLVHELGHNLGLPHANFWSTSGPGLVRASPPLPSHFETLPDPRTLPIHPDSQVAHETVTGPGHFIEYGDLWDIMGGGDADFGTAYKHALGWLPATAMARPPEGRTVHRLYAQDLPDPHDPRARSLRIQGPWDGPAGEREYSVELPVPHRGTMPGPGLLVRWVDKAATSQATLLLDGSPGTLAANADALLPVGRTFSDPRTGVHITATGTGIEDGVRWTEVVVVRETDPTTNRPPEVRLEVSVPALSVPANTPVTFTAVAEDPNGDPLLATWAIGDGTALTPGMVQTKAWSKDGDYPVRLEVTDMRGGVTAVQLAVRVGDPGTYRIRGRVLDTDGAPVADARVHNGILASRVDGRFVHTTTDATGAFILTGLAPGRYPVSAIHTGYDFEPRAPVEVRDADVEGIDFVARPFPRVTVTGPPEIPESAGFTNLFVFARTGPLEAPLTVLYRLGGTASGSTDYARPLLDRVVIPAGRASVELGVPILDDEEGEMPETLVATVVEPVRMSRRDASGNLYDVYYPGWDIREDLEGLQWTWTRPEYLPAVVSPAVVVVTDNDVFKDHTVSVTASDVVALEEPLVEGQFVLTRKGLVTVPLRVQLRAAGTATPGEDYEPLPESVTLEADETARVLEVRPVADGIEESEETVTLEIVPDPAYGIGVGSASVALRDRLVYEQTLALALRPDGQLQVTLHGAPGALLVLEASTDLRSWAPVRTNRLFNTTSAGVVLPAPAVTGFYRSVRW